jgi:hypothetical protein
MLRRMLGKISFLVLSKLIPHFIDSQSLGKDVQCKMNVNTHNRLTGDGNFTQSQSVTVTVCHSYSYSHSLS